MKTILLILLGTISALLISCSGSKERVHQFADPRVSITLHAPVGTGAHAPLVMSGERAEFTATIIALTGPFRIDWSLSNSDLQQHSAPVEIGTSSVEFLMPVTYEEQSHTMTAVFRNGNGVTQSDTVTFTLLPLPNEAPRLILLTHENGQLSFTASDREGDEFRFSAELASGEVQLGSLEQSGETGVLRLFNNNLLSDAAYSIEISVTDSRDAVETLTVNGKLPAFTLADDTLYALASRQRVKRGETVRIQVATGRTVNPLRFIGGCSMVTGSGASYWQNSFDAGSLDGNPDPAIPIDGIWKQMEVSNLDLTTDAQLRTVQIGNGSSRTEFRILPLDGHNVQSAGVLFSFEYYFSEPGIYRLRFEERDAISRTYYSNNVAQDEFFWSNTANDHQYNTIVVEE